MRHPHVILICFVFFFAAAAWGLYWLPRRLLLDAGLTGGWREAVGAALILLAGIVEVTLSRSPESLPDTPSLVKD